MIASIERRIADELSVKETQVTAAVGLLDDGATVPFVARYRKEVTGGLDDTQLRELEQRLGYLRELEERRATILKSIADQDKLSPALEEKISTCLTKTELEDLYLPYKPKRRTRAQMAREAGLEPLLDDILADRSVDPLERAAGYLNADAGFETAEKALDGAKQILMERFAEHAELLASLRDLLWKEGIVSAKVMDGKEEEGEKFRDYFEYVEPIAKIPSHRALALFRGRNESILSIALGLEEVTPSGMAKAEQNEAERRITRTFELQDNGQAADKWLSQTVRLAWRAKLSLKIELDLLSQLRENAEAEAIKVFASNLGDLLLAAPAGEKAVLGLDPGLRTGVKVAVVDSTGKLIDYTTIYPHVPKRQWDQSLSVLKKLVDKHNVALIAIGNGTASRETDQLAAELIKACAGVQKIVVSEAGASVYSASELAAKEFPDLDVSIRGAVSIARRLQDPLAELVKIDPKSIGVGQYQHDVNQVMLKKSLDNVVEDCVNKVGVDLNLASAPLLARVSGLSHSIASNIVSFRDANGSFSARKQLLKVPRMGAKTYQLAAGFLRVRDGDEPLDASSVHPEAYPLANRIAETAGESVTNLIGSQKLKNINARDFVDEKFGLPTIRDVLNELEKPGRDPRPEFKTAEFRDDVQEIKDLETGMQLNGVVTNVTNFGCFVDIGVHQDGLVHISQLADRFVDDPHKVVKAGDVVKVRVMEVDAKRKRIGLSMKSGKGGEQASGAGGKPQDRKPQANRGNGNQNRGGGRAQGQGSGAFAQAFEKAKK